MTTGAHRPCVGALWEHPLNPTAYLEDDGVSTIETVQRDDIRIRIVTDETPSEPYNCSASPLLRYEDAYGTRVSQVTEVGDYVVPDTIITAAQTLNRDTFARYLRIFHGATEVEFWHGDRWYVTFDTTDWRETYEITPVEGVADMTEWEAYCEGDVYGLITERRELLVTMTHVEQAATFCGDEAPHKYVMTKARELAVESESFTWIETDAVWGYYGQDYARQAAQSEVDSWVES